MKRLLQICLMIIMVQGLASAASFPSLPNTFRPRQLISASKIMANYSALLNAIIDGTKKINVAEIYINSTQVIDTSGKYKGGIDISDTESPGAGLIVNATCIVSSANVGLVSQKRALYLGATGSISATGGSAYGLYSDVDMSVASGSNAYGAKLNSYGDGAGNNYGILAQGGSTGSSGTGSNYGVSGVALNGLAANYGVYGYTSGSSSNNYGVYGYAQNGDNNYAVYGLANTGYAGYFQGQVGITATLNVTGAATLGGALTLGVATGNATVTTGNTNLTVTIGGTTYYIKAHTSQ